MGTKAFVGLLVAVLVLGGGVGGAFAGGMAFGKSRNGTPAGSVSTLQPSQSATDGTHQAAGQTSQDRLNGSRHQIAGQGGQLTDEQRAQFRQQSSGQSGQGTFAGRGGGFGGGLAGTVEQVEGNVVTVNTPQGPLQVTMGDTTVIRRFTTGTVADLQKGTQVTVVGQRGDAGVQAESILITPQGSPGLFGSGSPGGSQTDRSSQPTP